MLKRDGFRLTGRIPDAPNSSDQARDLWTSEQNFGFPVMPLLWDLPTVNYDIERFMLGRYRLILVGFLGSTAARATMLTGIDGRDRMRTFWMFRLVAVSIAGLWAVGGGSVEAQYVRVHRHSHVPVAPHVHTSHHHHDAMGHRIDDAGHHIDQFGHHTGNVGVYDNGARSYPISNGNSGYRINGNIYLAAPVVAPSVNVVGPPIVQNVVPVQQGIPQNIAYRAPQNVLPGTVVPARNPAEKIKILNPADSGGDVRYSLNGADYSIRPGYAQDLDNDRQWVISFGSGGPKGDVRYTLSPGTFKFKVTEAGWELVRAADQQATAQTTAPTTAPAPVPQSDGL